MLKALTLANPVDRMPTEDLLLGNRDGSASTEWSHDPEPPQELAEWLGMTEC